MEKEEKFEEKRDNAAKRARKMTKTKRFGNKGPEGQEKDDKEGGQVEKMRTKARNSMRRRLTNTRFEGGHERMKRRGKKGGSKTEMEKEEK